MQLPDIKRAFNQNERGNTMVSVQCRLFKSLAIISISLIFCWLILLAGCATTDKKEAEPVFSVAGTDLVKQVLVEGNTSVPIQPDGEFTTQDSAVIAYVKLKNLSGEHRISWEWIEPSGNRYYKTKDYPLRTSKDSYVEETATWHKLSIKGDPAEKHIGRWKVNVFLDNQLVAARSFMLKPDLMDISHDVDGKIPLATTDNPDAVAVVIGNCNYQNPDIPQVKYALNDAKVIRKYLIRTLGFREGNILFETDITKARFEALFGIQGNYHGMLFDYVKPGKSDVFVYYSGHGAPDPETSKAYFIPVDCDPEKIGLNGYPLDLFFKNLSKVEARRLTVVLDSCFSGGTDSGQWILKGASPALLKVKQPVIHQSNTVVLTSSESNQISSWLERQKHGLFTYFFLRALSGAADKDRNKEITFQEIYDFVSDRTEGVPYWAKRLHGGRTQTPTIQGSGSSNVFVTLPH